MKKALTRNEVQLDGWKRAFKNVVETRDKITKQWVKPEFPLGEITIPEHMREAFKQLMREDFEVPEASMWPTKGSVEGPPESMNDLGGSFADTLSYAFKQYRKDKSQE